MEATGTYVLREDTVSSALLRNIPRARGVLADLTITLSELNSFAFGSRPELERAIAVLANEIDEREAYWKEAEDGTLAYD
jgi:hypothetical protein